MRPANWLFRSDSRSGRSRNPDRDNHSVHLIETELLTLIDTVEHRHIRLHPTVRQPCKSDRVVAGVPTQKRCLNRWS